MKIAGIDHLVLTVRDLAASLDFYSRVLGMEVVTFRGSRKAVRFGDQKINLHQVGGPYDLVAAQPTPGSGDLCFVVETPLAEVIGHLRAAGIEIIAGPGERAGARGPMQSIYVRDPDGNLVELSEFREGEAT